VPRRLAVSESDKAEAVADSHECFSQFHTVIDPSEPAIIEMLKEAMRAYGYSPSSKPKLTSPSKVLQAIKGSNVGKASDQNGIPNSVLRHVPKRALTFLTQLFNAVLRKQYIPRAWNTLAWY
jgi:hypothetical protein